MVSFCRPQTCNFIEKETLARVFSFEFCEIFKEHLWTTAAAYTTYVSWKNHTLSEVVTLRLL